MDRQGSPETETVKKLVYTITKAGKSKIQRVGQEAGDPGKSCSVSPETKSAGRIPSSSREGGLFFFFLLKPATE